MPATEPGTWSASVAGLIAAGLSFMRLMDWLPMSDDQFNSLMVFIGLALPIAAALFTRTKTTPLVEPTVKLPSGESIPLIRSDNRQPTPQAMERIRKGG